MVLQNNRNVVSTQLSSTVNKKNFSILKLTYHATAFSCKCANHTKKKL